MTKLGRANKTEIEYGLVALECSLVDVQTDMLKVFHPTLMQEVWKFRKNY